MEKNEKKSFVKGAAILGIAGLLCKVIGAFFRIPLYNLLGDGMQYYEAVYPYYSFLITVSTAGLPTAISRMVAERVTIGDFLGAKRVFRKAQLMLVLFGAATAALMFGFADALAMSTVGAGAAPSFRAMAPSLLIVALMCAYRGYLQGMQLMGGTAVSQLVEQAGKLVIGLYLAKLWLPRGIEYGAMGAIVGVTISEFIALLVVTIFYLRRKRGFLPPQPSSVSVLNKGIVGGLLSIAVPVTIGGSIISITGMVDATVIKRLLMEVGFSEVDASMRYVCLRSNVSTIINMPAVLTVALAMSLVPAISASRTRNDSDGIRHASNMGLKLAMLLGMPCSVGLFVLAAPSINLLYNIDATRLEIAAALMRTSAISVAFISIVQTLTGLLQGIGKQTVPVINLAIGGAVKVVIMLVLMRDPSIEIQGAAISNVACYFVAGVLDMIFLIRYTRLKVDVVNAFLKPTLASIVMGAACYFSYVFFCNRLHGAHGESIAALAAIAAAAIIYYALIVLTRMFTREDAALLPGGRKVARLLGIR